MSRQAAKVGYSRTLRSASLTETFVKVRAIHDGVVCLDLGKGRRRQEYRGVFRVEAVNYALMSVQEQIALIEGFKGLLNGLSYQIQILIRNLPHDLSFVDEGPGTQGGPFEAITTDHVAFIRYLASRRALVKRQFYLIVPADEQKGISHQAERQANARSQIALRMEEMRRQLERQGLPAQRLSDEEAVAFFHSCLSRKEPPPTHALIAGTHGPLLNALEEEPAEKASNAAPRERKRLAARGQARADANVIDTGNLAELLSPASIHMTPFYLRVDDESTHEYLRTLTFTSYPRSAYPGWLDYLIQLDEPNVEFSLFIQPLPTEQVEARLSRKAIEFRGALLVAERAGKTADPTSKHALKDVEDLRDRLLRGDEHVFSISLFVLIRGAASLRELDERTTRMQTAIRSLDFRALPLHWQHHLGWLCCLPYGENVLPRYGRLLGTRAAGTCFCFTGATPSMDQGVLFGALHNGSLVVIDPFNAEEWQNANLAVFGQSGSGKSFFLKCILARLAPRTRIYVIDPDGEYSRWAQHAGAQHVFLTSASLQINPFDLTRAGERQTSEEPTFFREKLVNLITFLGLLVGTQGMLEQQEKSFLYRCLVKTYALYGITNDPQTHRYAPPCVADFYRVLCSATGEHDPYQVGVDRYQLAARLEQYLHLFPEQTTFTFNHPHLVFNVQQLAKSLKPVATFLITERLWTELSAIRAHAEQAGATASASLGHSPHSIVMIDEAWFLASFEDGANFLAEFARRIRKYGGGLWVGTQRSGDFLQSEQGKTLLAMCAAKLLFRHDTSSINEVTNTFRLHAGQRDFLLSAPRGEALLLTKVTAALEIVASPREQEMANTTLGVSSPPTPLALPAARPSTRFVPVIPEQGALHEPEQRRRRRS